MRVELPTPDKPDAVVDAIRQYGEFSAAALLLKKAELLRAMKAVPSEPHAAHQCAERLRDHYAQIAGAFAPSPHADYVQHIVDGDRELLTYDARAYELLLRRDRSSLGACREPLTHESVADSAIHIYSIDVLGIVWISRQPLSLVGLFQRAAPGALNHADLVEHRGLRVLAAGELIAAKRRERVVGAIVNNRSGHFLPTKRHLDLACSRIASVLAIPRESVVSLSVARNA